MSHKKISIEGNIGCGKTTVCESVLNNSRLPVFLEPVSDWIPYLDEFYKDPMKWGFAFNVNVILSYQKWKNNSFTAVYERSPLSCKHVFTNQQIKDGFIHPLELNIFNKISAITVNVLSIKLSFLCERGIEANLHKNKLI
jgi:deoxyadenosine/deoxycytidine kinase